MKIYVDMDGVLTDFSRHVSQIAGKNIGKKFNDDPRIWKLINKAGTAFWSTMPWMPDGHMLWNVVSKRSPTILSAPSRHPSSIKGKREWIAKNIPGTPSIIDGDKYKYAKPGDILIDDRTKNTSKWEAAGGIAILHKNAVDTIKQLKEMLGEEKTAAFKPVEDPRNPSRKILIHKGRGGRSTQRMIPKKSPGSYSRKKEKWKGLESNADIVRRIAFNLLKSS